MPAAGAKKRETKSTSPEPARLVTVTPTAVARARRRKSGVARAHGRLRSRPRRDGMSYRADVERLDPERVERPRPRVRPPSAGRAGKSSAIHAPSRRALSAPLLVAKRTIASAATSPSSHSAWALARVAWPHSGTSIVGVNQRSEKPSPSRSRNAVSERFISCATACIQVSSRGALEQTHGGGIAAQRLAGEGIDVDQNGGVAWRLHSCCYSRSAARDNPFSLHVRARSTTRPALPLARPRTIEPLAESAHAAGTVREEPAAHAKSSSPATARSRARRRIPMPRSPKRW